MTFEDNNNVVQFDDYAKSQVIQAQPDADPDKAAKSIEIGKDLGVPPTVALANFDTAEAQHKAKLVGGLFDSNTKLADYVNSNPIASHVSADDWHVLDSISEKAIGLGVAGVLSETFKGLKHGLESDALLQYKDVKNPVIRSAVEAYLNTTPIGGVDAAFKLLNMIVHGAAGGLGEAYVQAGGDSAMGMRLTRDIIAGAQVAIPEFMRAMPAKTINAGLLKQMSEVIQQGEPWIKAGEVPPVGLHPQTDKFHIKQASEDIKSLKELDAEAEKSATKQRSPELFESFINQHNENVVSVSAEGIGLLYGDKPPIPGDGPLGGVPGIVEQFNAALATGGDITMPLATWVTKVDKEVKKELYDHVRVRPNGVTVEEGKALTEHQKFMVEAYHGSPHEFDAFSMEKIGTGEGAQSYGHGLYFAENPKVAESYQKQGAKFVDQAGKDVTPGATYRVRIHAEKEHFLDWDKPASQQLPEVQEKLKQTMGAKWEEFQHADVNTLMKNGLIAFTSEAASKKLHEAGIPGIKYLDQGSRSESKQVIQAQIKTLEEQLAKRDTLTPEEQHAAWADKWEEQIAQFKEQLKTAKDETYNYVIFDDSIIEITHKNDVAVEGVRKQAGLDTSFGTGWERAEVGDWKPPVEAQRPGTWEKVGKADVFIPDELSPAEQAVFKLVDTELNRIVPKAVEHAPVIGISTEGGKKLHSGVYTPFKDRLPVILYALSVNDPVQVGRHEAIHHLYQYGFFTDAEWSMLKKAAVEEGWIDKERTGKGTSIRDRYKLSEDRMLEEAIADEFSYWNRNPDSPTLAAKVFEKLKAFLEKIYEKVMELRTNDPEVNDLFKKVESGEVGSREGAKPRSPSVFSSFAEKAQGELDVTRMEHKPPFKGGAGIFTAAQMTKVLEAERKVREADREYMLKQGEKLERKRQTREWKENEIEVGAEVRGQLESRPDLQSWRYFKYGEFNGEQLQRPRLSEKYLNKDQRKMLPDEWMRRDGEDPDVLAPQLGFNSGKELVESLISTESQRGELAPGRWWEKLVKSETDKAMLERYGDLEQNILAEAKQHVTGQDDINLLHEKTLLMAAQAGAEFSLTKEQIKTWTEKSFLDMRMKGIDQDKFFNAGGKAQRGVVDALIKGDAAAALRNQQWNYFNTLYAKHAQALEKAQNSFDRMYERFNDRDRVKSVPAEYQYVMQKVFRDLGLELKVTAEEIQRGMDDHGIKSVDHWTTQMAAEGKVDSNGIPIEVPPPKPIDQMTVGEFYQLKEAIDSLYDWGREEQKINIAGDKRDFESWENEVIAALKERGLRKRDKNGNLLRRRLWEYDAAQTKIEELASAIDFREEWGPLWTGLVVPFELAKAHDFDLKTKLRNTMGEIKKGFSREWQKSLEDVIPQNFVADPRGPRQITRWNLIKMILNFGNEENAMALARGMASVHEGWGKRANEASTKDMHDQIEMFIHANGRKEDFQFAQHIWDIFEGFRPDIDKVNRSTDSPIAKWVEARPIQHAQHGDFAGGYFPLFPNKDIPLGEHPSWERAIGERGLLKLEDYRFATTPRRHLKERIGATYWVDIESPIDQVAGEMQKQIHDIAYREAVVNASKILRSQRLKAAVQDHYGPEYWNQFRPWVEDIANNANAPDKDIAAMSAIYRRLRLNLSMGVLPLNYAVMLSPSTGLANPMAAYRFIKNGAKNTEFAMEKSHELKHLLYNYDRDLNEALDHMIGKGKLSKVQADLTKAFYGPLIEVEQSLRGITWTAEFQKQMAEHGDEGKAILLADRVMRRQHGTSSVVDMAALMRKPSEGWKTATMFMSFFNMTYNWSRGLPDALRQGRPKDAAKIMWGAFGTAALFNAALFTKRTEDESIFSTWAKSIASTPFQMAFGLNWAWNLTFENTRNAAPLMRMIETGVQAGKDVAKYGETGRKAAKHPIKDAAMGAVFAGVPGAMQVGRTAQFYSDWAAGKPRQQPRDVIEFIRGVATGEARLKKK